MTVRKLGLLTVAVALLALPHFAEAQAQAVNANIGGLVRDTSSAVLPGVTVTATNTSTGLVRTTVTDELGVYRIALLPLGPYQIKAELAGFRVVERSGISLSAGQDARVNFELAVGGVEEVLQVTAAVPVTEPLKIDLGRTISATEVKNLPNVARNTFNFALLQPNVTGFDNEEFGATRINANGSQMRTNYQIDGSSATQKDRAGLRMFQPSEVMVQEVQVVTSGFAPEFGQTTGMVFNAVTPSGTNQYSGQGSYRWRRKDYSARPLSLAATAPKPDTKVDNLLGSLGGPIVRDKAHFYVGYEWHRRDLSADRVIGVSPATASLLGLSADALGDGVIPAIQTVNMFIGKADVQVNPSHRLSGRWSLFKNSTPENIGGGLNTREVAVDFQDRMDSVGAQLISSFGASRLNELRFAFGRRDNPRTASAVAGPGPSVEISGVARFGGARPNPREFVEDYWQILDNFSWFAGRHNYKVGFDVQVINDSRVSDTTGLYVFPNVAAYLQARDGLNRASYTRFEQAIGDPAVEYSQRYFSLFFQDDFRMTSNLKLLYGVRYDLFDVPDADANAPFPASRDFRVDKNNFAPRVGIAWSLDDEARTVVRASTGIMYEPPLGMFYQDALQENGNPTLLNANVSPTQAGAPSFPGTLASLPPGVTPSRSIRTVSPDFDTQWGLLTNVQLERALASDLSVSVGYVNSIGRSLPTVLNSNVVPTGATLPDGRPLYSRTINAGTRIDPAFDTIFEVRSSGRSRYNALTLSANKRFTGSFQAQAFYTLSKAEDDGIIGGRYVVGSTDAAVLSDPSDQGRDYSITSWNVTHTFVASGVFAPELALDGVAGAILNNNQLSLIFQANSGLPFNILANRDLNLDGVNADRPNGIERQAGRLGRVANLDARYSRFVTFDARRRAEIFIEAKNVFNTRNVSSRNGTVASDALGNPLAPLPSEFPVLGTYQQRQAQVGVKFVF